MLKNLIEEIEEEYWRKLISYLMFMKPNGIYYKLV